MGTFSIPASPANPQHPERPPGCLTLLGAVTLKELALAPDPVRKTRLPA